VVLVVGAPGHVVPQTEGVPVEGNRGRQVAGHRVHFGRIEQADVVVAPQGVHGQPAEVDEPPDGHQFVASHASTVPSRVTRRSTGNHHSIVVLTSRSATVRDVIT
jgi:hypothetical protein